MAETTPTISSLYSEMTLTNEEKRVIAYQEDNLPTDSTKINKNTPLNTLNLNWREKELPERLRTKHVHRLHPYLGKYIPQLVEIFLRKYFQAGNTVVDPFAGSGTTLVQANELGINSIGFDISAFNVILCRAKTTKYDLSKVRREVLDILAKVEKESESLKSLPLFEENNVSLPSVKSDSDYLKTWFAPEALRDLLNYRSLIENYYYQDLLKVILSRAARSSRLTTHFDLDFPKKPQLEPYQCFKHSRTCKPTTNSLQFLKRYSLDSLRRVEEFALLQTDAKVAIHHADSKESKVPLIDGVITSPPYVGLIDYHEQHIYAYHLFGLEDKRSFEIGAAANGSGLKAKKTYQEDLALVFKRLAERLIPGGRMIVVAGDKANLYEEIATLADVEVEAVVNRHVNRRTGRRSNEFYESVFIWRKRK